MDDIVYDLVIVGAGMIGSAAARYASQYNNLKVCVIGPDEPESKSADRARDIYGAHYAEARITNTTQSHPIWAKLSARSMQQYRHLEKLSGIDFYTEVGSFYIGTQDGRNINTVVTAARDVGNIAQVLSPGQCMHTYPFIKIKSCEEAVYQQVAGYVNPRKLVQAELLIAQRNKCDIIRDIVSKLIYPTNTKQPVTVLTDLGNIVYAKKVLLAPGAFIELRELLPNGLAPEMQLFTQSVMYAEVSQTDLSRMRSMPCITRHIETDADAHNDCYILPPVKYPDGKHYIKLGHGPQFDKAVHKSRIKEWYCQDVPTHIRYELQRILRDVFPDFTPVSIKTDTCITTRTEDRALFLDLITPQVGVAIAGNGYAAKACDYIGNIAADLIVTSKWNCDLPQNWFKFRNISSKL